MNGTKTEKITREIVEFVTRIGYEAFPSEALRIAKRCILDGLGVMLAGSSEACSRIVRKHALDLGGKEEASLLGGEPARVPAPLAALVNATAGHAQDWDDTQLSTSPDRIFGLLTHPTIPPLSACLALSEKLGGVSGRRFLTAFLAGFEVECKVAEAIRPDHYRKGFHSSGTIGVFGAATAAAHLLELDETALRHNLGMAASMAAGIRVNFGTMTKPLHVGRAAHNGVTSALLARDGFEANGEALDGPWGFFQVFGGGVDTERIVGTLGNPFSIVDPGVSIKPYPCGSLTHPTLDAMRALVTEHDLKAEDVREVVLYAGSNILNPIRYPIPRDELEAKFCMPFLLAAILLSRKAGVREFTRAFVLSQPVQEVMPRIRTELDPEIEAQGWDRMRSRIEVSLNDGTRLIRESDDRYRGGPDFPLTDEDLEAKFTDCTEASLAPAQREKVLGQVANLETLEDTGTLVELLSSGRPR